MRTNTWITSFAILLSLDLCASAVQEPTPIDGPTPVELPGQVSEAQEEMLELFRDIEENLKTVDILLSDAGAGDTSSLSEVKEAGIGRLLESSRAKSQQILTDIDRLLEIAEEMGQEAEEAEEGEEGEEAGEQSGSPSQGPEGSQPGQQGSQSTRREQTPEGPGQSPSGEEPMNGEQPGGEEPSAGEQPTEGQGETPDDSQQNANKDPENKTGNEPPIDPTGAGSKAGSSRDRWGDLPVHYQDVFRGEDSGEMPVRYREWIDAYYRRLNQREGR